METDTKFTMLLFSRVVAPHNHRAVEMTSGCQPTSDDLMMVGMTPQGRSLAAYQPVE